MIVSEAFAFQNLDLMQVHSAVTTGQEIVWNQILQLYSSSYSAKAASKATRQSVWTRTAGFGPKTH